MLLVCKRPVFPKAKAKTLPYARGKARGAGDTTTLHSLLPAPAFECRVSRTAVNLYEAC